MTLRQLEIQPSSWCDCRFSFIGFLLEVEHFTGHQDYKVRTLFLAQRVHILRRDYTKWIKTFSKIDSSRMVLVDFVSAASDTMMRQHSCRSNFFFSPTFPWVSAISWGLLWQHFPFTLWISNSCSEKDPQTSSSQPMWLYSLNLVQG